MTSEPRWTPGPWKLSFDEEHASVTADGHGNVSRSYRASRNPKRNDANDANARLIAAAPEMAEAILPIEHYLKMRDAKPLNGMGDSVHRIHTSTEWEAEITMAHLRALVAALAKARGE